MNCFYNPDHLNCFCDFFGNFERLQCSEFVWTDELFLSIFAISERLQCSEFERILVNTWIVCVSSEHLKCLRPQGLNSWSDFYAVNEYSWSGHTLEGVTQFYGVYNNHPSYIWYSQNFFSFFLAGGRHFVEHFKVFINYQNLNTWSLQLWTLEVINLNTSTVQSTDLTQAACREKKIKRKKTTRFERRVQKKSENPSLFRKYTLGMYAILML